MKITVMAGTPIDTKFGEDLLRENGITDIIPIAISENPTEQTLFQTKDKKEKEKIISQHINNVKKDSSNIIFVYCNSLSASVDFDYLAEVHDVTIIRPLDIYKELAKNYNKVAMLAANAQGLAGIEKVIVESNPNLQTIGITLLEMVKAIEDKEDPEKIADDFNFKELLAYIEANNVDVIILGCTHFPYIEKIMSTYTDVEILNPAMKMIDKIKERI
ncbi:MAG: glutamate racemase [Gemella sp.]|nr:glutamate racemase [Gemella sp.]